VSCMELRHQYVVIDGNGQIRASLVRVSCPVCGSEPLFQDVIIAEALPFSKDFKFFRETSATSHCRNCGVVLTINDDIWRQLVIEAKKQAEIFRNMR